MNTLSLDTPNTAQSIKIEKGISIPARRNKDGVSWPHIAQSLEVGDSVFCPTRSNVQYLRIKMRQLGYKATTRAEGTGTRVWRIQ